MRGQRCFARASDSCSLGLPGHGGKQRCSGDRPMLRDRRSIPARHEHHGQAVQLIPSRTGSRLKLFQAPFRSGIRIDAYQPEPLRKALTLPRVNLFIADDFGLCKTIEAGLIAHELLMRKKVRDIVVACPPSVLSQWQGELNANRSLEYFHPCKSGSYSFSGGRRRRLY